MELLVDFLNHKYSHQYKRDCVCELTVFENPLISQGTLLAATFTPVTQIVYKLKIPAISKDLCSSVMCVCTSLQDNH